MAMIESNATPIESTSALHVVRTESFEALNVLRITDRREVVLHYLDMRRRSGRRIPADAHDLAYDDANSIDAWLKRTRMKVGVMAGFRRWAYVALTWDNLLECAVVDSLTRGMAQRHLGALLEMGFLNGWEPITPNPVWHEPIRAGLPLPESEALILRPALPSEGGRFYVEDGSGRATYLAANRPAAEIVAFAYVGFDPDTSSDFMRKALDGGHFVRAASRYQRLEDV